MAHLIAEVSQLFLFRDDDFPDNQSSLEFHLKVFTSLVDLRPKNPSNKIIKIRKELDKKMTNIIYLQKNLDISTARLRFLSGSNIFLFSLILTYFTY